METLDIDSLKRDNASVKTLFAKKSRSTLCSRDCYVLLPDNFVKKGLAEVGNPVISVCIIAIVENNKYATMAIPIKQKFYPNKLEKILVEDKVYYKLYFSKGDFFFAENNAICDQGFYYELFDLIYLQGKIPFYINYQDLANLFLEAKKYGNSKIGENRIAWEIIAGLIARDPNNPTIFYKDFIHKDPKNIKIDPVFKGFKDTIYGYDNTSANLIGGYLGDGIIKSIVDPEKKSTNISKVLRY